MSSPCSTFAVVSYNAYACLAARWKSLQCVCKRLHHLSQGLATELAIDLENHTLKMQQVTVRPRFSFELMTAQTLQRCGRNAMHNPHSLHSFGC